MIWNALTRAEIVTIKNAIDKSNKNEYNSKRYEKTPFFYGPVKVSTGILKQDKRGVPSNHEKGSNLKLNADENVALAA